MDKAVWQIPRNKVDLMDVETPEATPGVAQPELHIMRYDRQETEREQVLRCEEGQYCWGLETNVVHEWRECKSDAGLW